MSPRWQPDEHYTNIRDLDAARKKLIRVDEEPTDDVTAEAIWLAAIVLTLGIGFTLIGLAQVVIWGVHALRWAAGA
jgi:hypothetical protein